MSCYPSNLVSCINVGAADLCRMLLERPTFNPSSNGVISFTQHKGIFQHSTCKISRSKLQFGSKSPNEAFPLATHTSKTIFIACTRQTSSLHLKHFSSTSTTTSFRRARTQSSTHILTITSPPNLKPPNIRRNRPLPLTFPLYNRSRTPLMTKPSESAKSSQ